MYRKPIRFALSVNASTNDIMEYTVREDCTLERMVLCFPPGSAGDLRLTPYITPPDKGPIIPIIERDDDESANSYLSGDDYVYDLRLSMPIRKNSKICVSYNNVDATYAHFFDMVFEIDEWAGLGRVGGGM